MQVAKSGGNQLIHSPSATCFTVLHSQRCAGSVSERLLPKREAEKFAQFFRMRIAPLPFPREKFETFQYWAENHIALRRDERRHHADRHPQHGIGRCALLTPLFRELIRQRRHAQICHAQLGEFLRRDRFADLRVIGPERKHVLVGKQPLLFHLDRRGRIA